jgi:tRNA 2-thiouridine synthesizing protein A
MSPTVQSENPPAVILGSAVNLPAGGMSDISRTGPNLAAATAIDQRLRSAPETGGHDGSTEMMRVPLTMGSRKHRAMPDARRDRLHRRFWRHGLAGGWQVRAGFSAVSRGANTHRMSERLLDLRGLRCPLPVLKAKKALREVPVGGVLVLECTDPLTVIDIPHLVNQAGHRLSAQESRDGLFIFRIDRLR